MSRGNAGAMVHLPIYTTCPEGVVHDTPQGFRQRLVNEAKWSEEAGCDGMLIYTDNKSLDPWVVAQVLIEHTKTLVPMVAVNPIEMHPFNVARMISAFGFMHSRRIDLNLVAGGFADDLHAMGDGLGHAERYDRLAEWGTILRELIAGAGPVTHAGRYVTVNGLAVKPALSTALTPHYFVSGTSDSCLRLQAQWGATRLSYPREISEYKTESELSGCGMRLGIIARDTAEEAWDEARRRFPPDLAGEALHDFAAETVESRWHRTLSQEAMRSYEPQGCYWIYPFRSYQTLCPYFVGTCQEVGDLLARYIALGLKAILLDEVIGLDDLNRQMEALRYAQEAAPRLSGTGHL